MKITFGGAEDMALFWSYVKMLIMAANPWIMLSIAVIAVGLVLGIIVRAWKESAKEKEDDDMEYREY
ncbi:hypothetical protein [Peribacillus sp. TH24]|uniref:hypothetical protein n=1 Tax=Peribacillus sp. TH24 TaxID=2798483 RepID=UPI00191195B5|nr:hypothetical protein [Peribacillus sp. TH24]MBK5447033.1 hypothetical protein [Peribacillus sp. TH24]MBK5447064.1 hypothetical protein [Peribacillus sp. TH24]